MPTTCWSSIPPKETNMLSMRNSSILITCSSELHVLNETPNTQPRRSSRKRKTPGYLKDIVCAY
jgi:hypothetical protein